jgi:hypothetical protein
MMRLRLAMAVLALGCCAIAACTNSTGGSSTMPGGQLPQAIGPTTSTPVPTPTPNVMSGNIQVLGDGNAQTLPAPGDFKVTATFPKATASSTPAPITLNASVSVPGPGGIPAYGAADKPKNGLFGKVGHREQSPALLYVTFESDKGATFATLPVIDVVIPLSVLEAYGTDPTIGMAIYDPANENKWTKDIAQAVNATPTPTPSGGVKVTPSPTPTPTQTPTPTPTPSGSPTPRPPGAPAPTPSVSTTPTTVATPRGPVPSMEVRFVPTQRMMKLLAKKSLSLVVYAEPAATPTPEPTGSAKTSSSAKASASPAGSASAAATAAASATAAAATNEPSPSAVPSASP